MVMIIWRARIIGWLLLVALILWDGLGPERVGRRAALFTESHRYADGLAVTVTDIAHGTLDEMPQTDDPLTKLGDPYTVLTVTLHNGAPHTFEVWFIGRVSYGRDRRQAGRFATRAISDVHSAQVVAPGETSYPYDLGFLLPTEARGDLVFELTIDRGEHEPAIFAGPATAGTGAR